MRSRRNTDWEDLPPMFTPLPGAPAKSRSGDEWSDLPPVFAPPSVFMPPAPIVRAPEPDPRVRLLETGIPIRLRPMFPWLRDHFAQVLDVLRQDAVIGPLIVSGHFADEQGDFPDMEAVCLVRHAVWKLAGDRTQDDEVRSQALEIEKAMDTQTQGRSAACLDRIVYGLQRAGGVGSVVSGRGRAGRVLALGPSSDLAGIERVIASLGDVYDAEAEVAWDSYDWREDDRISDANNDCPDCLRGKCEHIEEARHDHAVGEGMWKVAEALQKAGIEAKVIADDSSFDSPYVVWFSRPGAGSSPYWQVWLDLGEVSVGPMTGMNEELFWSVMFDGYVNNPPVRRAP